MIGELVLVTVSGQIIEKGFIEDFSSNNAIYLFNDVNFLTRISNLGNVHFKPGGNIEIESLFGRKIDTVAVNDQGGNVLPDSIRKFETNWKSGKILVGPYKANLNLIYGETGKSLADSVIIWMIPWWLLVIIAVLALSAGTYVIVRKNKKKPKQKKGKKRKNIFKKKSPDDSGRVVLR